MLLSYQPLSFFAFFSSGVSVLNGQRTIIVHGFPVFSYLFYPCSFLFPDPNPFYFLCM